MKQMIFADAECVGKRKQARKQGNVGERRQAQHFYYRALRLNTLELSAQGPAPALGGLTCGCWC